MAIKVNGTQVIGNSRQLTNIASVDATTVATLNSAGVGGGGFAPQSVSGTSQSLNLSDYNFFDAGTGLSTTARTTLSFASVPTEARWQYSYVAAPNSTIGYNLDQIETATSIYTDPRDIFLPYGMTANSNGTFYYVWDYYGNLHQYTLSTAFNMSTASFTRQLNRTSFPNHTPEQGSAQTGYFKSDGTKLFLVSGFGDTMRLMSWNLSTAWNISTLSNGQSRTVGVHNSIHEHVGMDFKSDGTAVFISLSFGTNNNSNKNRVLKYTLSTAWDVSTASYDSSSPQFLPLSNEGSPQSIRISGDGRYLFSAYGGQVKQWTFGTPFDVTSLSTSAPFKQPITEKPDGSVFYARYIDWWGGGTHLVAHQGSNGTNLLYCDFETLGLNFPILPSSVSNEIDTTLLKDGATVSLDFFTTNGGTTVKIIGQEVVG